MINGEKLERIMGLYLQQQQIFQTLLSEIIHEEEIDNDD